MVVFEERGNWSTRRKPFGAEKRINKLNPHITPESIPGHIGVRRVLSPLRHPWTPSLNPVPKLVCGPINQAIPLIKNFIELLAQLSLLLDPLSQSHNHAITLHDNVVLCDRDRRAQLGPKHTAPQEVHTWSGTPNQVQLVCQVKEAIISHT